MRTVVRAALQSIHHLTRIHTRMCFAPNCNTSPGLAGAVGSSYEDYSVTKDTEEQLIEDQVSTAERLSVTKYCCKLPFGKPDSV